MLQRYYDAPFLLRVLLALGVFGVVAVSDLRRRGAHATKWREYSFLFALATAAALFGALNDLVTATLSPEYFVLGKGIAGGPGLLRRAAGLGAEAGFVAGAVAAAAILWANTGGPGRTALAYGLLARRCVLPLITALLGGATGWLGAGTTTMFLRVRAIHLGLYLGLALGTAWVVASLRCMPGRRHPPCSYGN